MENTIEILIQQLESLSGKKVVLVDNFVSFKKVKIGDTCIDYHGKKHVIFDKGSLKQLCAKYEEKMEIGFDEYGTPGKTPAVAVKETGSFGNKVISVYIYDRNEVYVPLP